LAYANDATALDSHYLYHPRVNERCENTNRNPWPHGFAIKSIAPTGRYISYMGDSRHSLPKFRLGRMPRLYLQPHDNHMTIARTLLSLSHERLYPCHIASRKSITTFERDRIMIEVGHPGRNKMPSMSDELRAAYLSCCFRTVSMPFKFFLHTTNSSPLIPETSRRYRREFWPWNYFGWQGSYRTC
jgi:hypothetical protein